MSEHAIVFCPGWTGMPPKRWNPLLTRFQENGFDVVSINYRNFGFGEIEATAGRTGRVLKSLRGSYEHICLVGHSMGGLVARRALVDNPGCADSLITIGTPHKGVQGAIKPFSWLPSIRDMLEESDFRNTCTEVPDVPTLIVSAQFDVIVPDAKWECGGEHVTIPWATHSSVLFSQRAFGEIYSWLNYEVLNLSGTDDKGLYTKVNL